MLSRGLCLCPDLGRWAAVEEQSKILACCGAGALRVSAGQLRAQEGAGRPARAALTPSVSLPPFHTSHRFPSENFKELHFYLFLHNYILFLIISFIHFSTFNFGAAAHSFFWYIIWQWTSSTWGFMYSRKYFSAIDTYKDTSSLKITGVWSLDKYTKVPFLKAFLFYNPSIWDGLFPHSWTSKCLSEEHPFVLNHFNFLSPPIGRLNPSCTYLLIFLSRNLLFLS